MSTVNRLRLAAVVAGLALTGAACGGGGGNSPGAGDVASLGAADGEQAAGAEAEKTASKDPEEAMLDFARCMREHGIDMPDPQVNTGGGGERPAIALRLDGDISPEKMEKANQECRPLMGDAGPMANISPEQRQEMQDKMVEHARCMRENGIDMPDPTFETGAGGGMVKMEAGRAGAIDPGSDEFAAAAEKCGELFGGATTVVGGKADGQGGPQGSFSFGASAGSSDK